jgi:ketosteroid isomerase-like protein
LWGKEEMSMSQENVQIIRGIYDAFGRGDVPAVLEQMDQSIEWILAENSIYADLNPYVGPQAVAEGLFARLGSEWEGYTVTPEEFLDAGDRIVVLGTYSGTYKATGRDVRAQFAHVWGLREGRVVSYQQYTDTKQFAEAVV